ncbi:galactose-1-phosphate uridylyltransferase, partial [archaeon CG07_land_8_20_14_0_80_38_8]
IWIIPKKHSPVFARINDKEINDFALILRGVIGKLSSCLSDPPFNYAIHTAPSNDEDAYNFHWHLEIIPRLTITAGFELGTGVYINIVAPEKAASFLKESSESGATVVPA